MASSKAGGSLAAAGDVYGNGNANLFYYNSPGNNLSLYTNNGTGVFGSNTTFNLPMRLPAVADVNGDGKVDFIAPNYGNNIVYIFTNNGGGIYASNASFKVRAPVGVTAADVNGDGWVDLICRSTNNALGAITNTITIWTNNGSGVFGSNTIFGVGSQNQQVLDVKAAQLFGDGQVDLVFAVTDAQSHQADNLIIYTNNGSGGYGSNLTLTVGSQTDPAGVAVADVNGDGTLDLISANSRHCLRPDHLHQHRHRPPDRRLSQQLPAVLAHQFVRVAGGGPLPHGQAAVGHPIRLFSPRAGDSDQQWQRRVWLQRRHNRQRRG